MFLTCTLSKSHAMDGHALALFMVDALVDALTDLADHETTDTNALLMELEAQELELHEKLRNADLQEETMARLYFPNNNAPKDPTLDVNVLWHGPSMCRTARLPAQSRYLGYTTNTDKVGGSSVLGSETYDTGIPITEARNASTRDDSMVLVYEPGGIEREECDVLLKPDYKDFFYTDKRYGSRKLTIPNEKEREAYGYDPTAYKGLIVVAFVTCPGSRCGEGELRPEDLPVDKCEISVNGKPVSELLSLGFDTWMLKGEEGLSWEPDSSGTFEIGFLVKEDDAYIRISSIILY